MHRTTRSRRLLVALAALALVGGGASVATADPVSTAGARIVGGQVSPPGAWPAQAALLFADVQDPERAQFCGGTLIAPRWVLTAGHCAGGLDELPVKAGDVQVAVGTQRLSQIRPADRVDVTKIVLHEGFAYEDGWVAINDDVALLRLSRPLPGPYAQLAGPRQDGAWGPGTVATVSGWGTRTAGEADYPDALHQVDVRVIKDARCQAIYPELDGGSNLCAGWLKAGGRDACQGDSGGPLWALIGSSWRQIGIVSSGQGCAEPGHPGTYGDVRGLYPWIMRQIG